MENKISREALVKIVEQICSFRDENGNKLSEQAHFELIKIFEKSIKHTGGTDIIYYPDLVGFKDNATAEEIVAFALLEDN